MTQNLTLIKHQVLKSQRTDKQTKNSLILNQTLMKFQKCQLQILQLTLKLTLAVYTVCFRDILILNIIKLNKMIRWVKEQNFFKDCFRICKSIIIQKNQLLLFILKRDLSMELPPMILPNTGNMGIPICLFAYGSQGLGVASAVASVIILFHFTLGVFLAKKKFFFYFVY